MNNGPQTRDYFAEMYVARILADKRWSVNLNIALKRQLGMLHNLYQAGLLHVL